MSGLPKLNPRTQPVSAAAGEIGAMFWQQVEKHGLSYGEAMGVIAGLCSSLAKEMVRAERHPGDPDTPGDVIGKGEG